MGNIFTDITQILNDINTVNNGINQIVTEANQDINVIGHVTVSPHLYEALQNLKAAERELKAHQAENF